MDTFYEESAVNQREKKQRTIVTILHIVQIIFIVLAVILKMICDIFEYFAQMGLSHI